MRRVRSLFWQHLWLVPDEEAGTLKLRKISRHYRILGSVMSPVFLVSWCFKNTHHMSFSPDVMHIFCQSPTSLLAIFLPSLTWITVSAWHCSSSLITVEQKIKDFCARRNQPTLMKMAPLVHSCPTACAGGEPHKTVWSQIYLAGMQIRMNNCQLQSWNVSHQASTTVSSEGLVLPWHTIRKVSFRRQIGHCLCGSKPIAVSGQVATQLVIACR